MQTHAHAVQHGLRQIQPAWPAPRLPGVQTTEPPLPRHRSGLNIRVLRTEEERSSIADLRRLAAFGVEKDLGLELAAFENVRDAIGIVTAIYLDERLVATIRFVPTGHGMTAAERLQKNRSLGACSFGSHSWEVGRIIMAPEDRGPVLLARCLGLALAELLKREQPQHLHASVTLSMARLWRRFGMTTVATVDGTSGAQYALVEGKVDEIAAILQVPSASH